MIKELKKALLRIFLGVEVIIFCIMYVFGQHGLLALHSLHKENQQVEKEVDFLKAELENITEEIQLYNKYPFYKEKLAREQLHLKKSDEIIYYLS